MSHKTHCEDCEDTRLNPRNSLCGQCLEAKEQAYDRKLDQYLTEIAETDERNRMLQNSFLLN